MVEKVEGRIGKKGTVCEKQTENSRVLILAKFLRGRSLSLSLSLRSIVRIEKLHGAKTILFSNLVHHCLFDFGFLLSFP